MRRPHHFAVERPAILVVDDERNILTAIERLLARKGVQCHLASGPDEAREMLKTINVQVVCSDIQMGKENGISFLKWVREHHPKLQRILLTAYSSQTEYLTSAINEAGVHRFLAKPFDPTMLIETVKQSIEQWAVMDERDELLKISARQNESLKTLNADLEIRVAERTQQLEAASQEWRRTFDSIADPMTVIDDQLVIRRANRAAAELASIDDVKDLIDQRCHEALFGKTEQCEHCPIKCLDEGSEWENERTGRRWSAKAWKLRDVEGQSPRVVCRYHDVTEQRLMQHQVVRMERMAALGQMAGSVAHEINNPLTGILSFSQLVARTLERPDQRSMVEDIVAQARRCSDIVSQLLDFSGRGNRSMELEEVTFSSLLEECERLATFQFLRKFTVKLEFECDADVRPIHGSRINLQSVVLNLVSNAVHAMDGVGTVKVHVVAVPDSHRVRMHVTDTGPGVPEDIKDRIFDPFFTTKAANRQGTGLGLAIVSDIVRDHRGSVEVNNLPQGGACFTVELPTTVA